MIVYKVEGGGRVRELSESVSMFASLGRVSYQSIVVSQKGEREG